MKMVLLTQGQVALVDDADYESVSQFKWYAVKIGQGFYAARSVRKSDGKRGSQSLHSFLMPGVARIDPRDGNRLNAQRENLRPATHCKECDSLLNEQNRVSGRAHCKKCYVYVRAVHKLKSYRKYYKYLSQLKSKPCADCHNSFPTECMDFDHVRGTKKFKVSKSANRDRTALQEEIAKCDLVCANCHRIRTKQRQSEETK